MHNTISRTLRVLAPLLVVLAATFTVRPSGVLAVSVAIVQGPAQNNGASTSLTPTLRLKSNVAAGDYVVVFVAHETSGDPAAPTDSRGNTYRWLGGGGYDTSVALGGAWYGAKMATAGSLTITFHNAAASAYGAYELSGYTLTSHGGVEGSEVQIVDPPATHFTNGADVGSVGDLLLSLIVCPTQATFTLDPASAPDWVQDYSASSPSVSAQTYHASPAQVGSYSMFWNSNVACNGIVASLTIPHA